MVKKSSKASHLELRYQTYYAVLYVPKDVRHIIGKGKFFKSTQTSNLKIAQQRAIALVLGWQAEIDNARYQADDPFIASALGLREELRTNQHRHLVKDVLDEEVSRYRREHGELAADTFKDIATSKQQPLSAFTSGWKNHQVERGLRQKTIDQMFGDIEILVSWFPTATGLTPDRVEDWIKKISAKGNLSASTSSRILGSCRNFFVYLKSIGVVAKTTVDPFITPNEFKISNKPNSKAVNKSVPWIPFKPSEVSSLYRLALADHQQLADLIMVGAYSGARIEEICSLKCTDIDLHANSFTITDAKTHAGKRVVPLHPKIKERVKTMMAESADGFLFSRLTLNKYGDRSNAIGKRFGRLKKKHGFSNSYVFHSIRKTFTTMLEENGILENLAADIVGHEKPNLTYGLYSGGASLAKKRTAIRKISYDFDVKVQTDQKPAPAKRRQSATKQAPAKKSPAKKSVVKPTPAKKAPATKSAAKKATSKPTPESL